MRSENVDLHMFYRCFSTLAWVAEASSCAMSGLSWGYLEGTWGLLGSALGASCATFGQSLENLKATWLNFG